MLLYEVMPNFDSVSCLWVYLASTVVFFRGTNFALHLYKACTCCPVTLKRKTRQSQIAYKKRWNISPAVALNSNWNTIIIREHSLAFIICCLFNKNVSLQSYDKFSNFTAILVNPLSRNTARQLVADTRTFLNIIAEMYYVVFLMICKHTGLVSAFSLIITDREDCIDHTFGTAF